MEQKNIKDLIRKAISDASACAGSNGEDKAIVPKKSKAKPPKIVNFDIKSIFPIRDNLEEWKNSKTTRTWGWYRVLDEKPGYKVKELVIEPGKSLSDQRHSYRSEHWYVLSGSCVLNTEYANYKQQVRLNALTSGFIIGRGVWHQAINNSDVPCHVLEVQHGEKCVEEDIERREDQ